MAQFLLPPQVLGRVSAVPAPYRYPSPTPRSRHKEGHVPHAHVLLARTIPQCRVAEEGCKKEKRHEG